MRVFISYRRDDTAGRAGRLGDGLKERLGTGNVFQDVGSIEPGVDFEEAIARALAKADATIVVIGPDWATARGSGLLPRLHQAEDYVRREVAAALASGGPVVPVLVGDALLPEPDELPDALVPLLKRQAISVRDGAWHEDVDSLVRRLRAAVERPKSRRRIIWLGAAGVLIVLGTTSALVWWTHRGSDPRTRSTPACSAPDGTWTALPLVADATGTYELADGTGRKVQYTATAVRINNHQSDWRILVDVQVSNNTAPVEGTSKDDWYVDSTDFHRLVIDGIAGDRAACFNFVAGAQSLPPGQRAIARVGFDSTADPGGVELILETAGTPIELVRGGS